ncbi:heat-inducible transcription repressor HrcA [Alkalibaculum sp. M08DMB]|uniref:Heat-inducible transcription repressor HrcA n=1 Tax=Alkalibaculum sporogenes TaxID=2655001 RepID=A0A6A7K5H2_9FIRM|nr:heat-inducible transcriptional repressor HrcA [Alkalibaculum sporogenes]MPW24635.1 heat-inducible transcription repressor HrcA [Alkalibaculum sporogenes]
MDKMKERKLSILRAIIQDYIITAEPIGSRTIAKKYNLGVSAATIRNEMADLEEMGLLIQPHTSAGRVPSEKAYRLYVDQLMQIKKLDEIVEKSIRDSYKQYVEQIEKSIELTAKLLAQLTSYTSLVLTPEIRSLNCKLVQLIRIQDERILMVIITKENVVKNHEIVLSQSVEEAELTKLTNILNYFIKDLDISMINSELIKEIDQLSIKENQFLQDIISNLKNVLLDSDNKNTLYSNGMTNLLNYPEFNDIDKVKHFLEIFQEKQTIAELLKNYANGTHIVIGNENTISQFKDCSLLTATYQFNGQNLGTIGVVGPIRMNYDHVVSVLAFLSQELNKQINQNRYSKNTDER